MTNHVTIARTFSAMLLDSIGEDNMRHVLARNETSDYAGSCCASHDFCDANMTMHAAFIDVTGRNPIGENGMTQADTDIWNLAWETAKQSRFFFQG